MNFGGGVGLALAILSVLVGLAAVATFITLGIQRGRVERLEKRNDDLEKEIGDEKRRREGVAADLKVANDLATERKSEIDRLSGRVETLATLPLQALATAVEGTQELLAGHHREAMFGQELMSGMLLDLLHMQGDKRSHRTIAQAMRAKPDDPDA